MDPDLVRLPVALESVPSEVVSSSDDEALLQTMFRTGRLAVAQWPMVDLDTGEALAVELVTHGPPGVGLTPRRMRELIGGSPYAHTLDLAKRQHALHHLQTHPVGAGVPVVLDSHLPSLVELDLAGDVTDAPVVLLIDARELLRRPAETLRLLAAARAEGWEIGLREVGADPQTLAALSVVEPALAVLSAVVLADPTSPLAIETLQTTTSFHRSSGAVVAAEELDSPDAVTAARALGATLGSGPMFDGAPVDRRRAGQLFQLFTPPLPVPHHSPYELAVRRHAPHQAGKDLLIALSQRLERTAGAAGSSAMVLAAFQTARHFTPATAQRYAALAETSTLVVVAASGLTDVPAGVSLAPLDPSDPLVDEWTVLVLAPTMSAMLAARDLHSRGVGERDRQFDYVLSYDRDLVAHAARSVLTRVTSSARTDRS